MNNKIMKIEVNNQRYLIIKKHEVNNWLIIETYNHKNELESKRSITDIEFVELYNILVYANNNNKKIHELWGI